MPIDLDPIANFDASSATSDQTYIVQTLGGDFATVHGDAVDPDIHVAFALINPFTPEASAGDGASVDEAPEAEAA